MSKKKNKVKYGLTNVHYAVMTTDESGLVKYAKPVPIPGAVSLSLDAKGDMTEFYADGILYYSAPNNAGYDGDLEIALIPESFATDVLGEKMDNKKVLIENVSAVMNPFALLFEFEGDAHKIRHVLYRCTVSRPKIESQTREESVDVKTDSLSITASALDDGNVKAKTSDDVDDDVYLEWYNTVYIPQKNIGILDNMSLK